MRARSGIMTMLSEGAARVQPTPRLLLLLCLFAIIAAEAAIMVLLGALAPLPRAVPILLDTGLLLGVVALVLFLFSYRPLQEQLARLAEAQRIARLGSWELDLAAGKLRWSRETFRLFGRAPEAGAPSFEEYFAAIHPRDRERVRSSATGDSARDLSSWAIDYRVVLPDGSIRDLHEEGKSVRGRDGRVARRFGTVQDVTERVLAAEELRKDEMLHETLVGLHEGADRLELRELVEFGLEEMVRVTGSAIGYLFFYDEETERLSLAAWSRAVRESCRCAPLPVSWPLSETGLWGEPVRRRRPVVTNDYAADRPGKRGLPAGHLPVVRHLALPVLFEARIVAVVGVGNKGEPYGAEDERRLALFSRGLWEIVQRKRREEEISYYQRSLRWLLKRYAAAEEEERRRLADDLHDTIVQDLAAARLRLAELRVGEDDPARAAQLAEVSGVLTVAIHRSRALTCELSSPVLRQFGVEAAVEQLAEETARRHGLRVACETGEPIALPDDRRDLLFRIAQELLRNVAKHAGASAVTVRLGREGNVARLEVRDDGRGFPDAPRSGATESGGFGLFSIRERLEDAGGALRIETAPGAGARVVVELPAAAAGDGVPR